jgi:ABC-type thiamin/hydroxymethylpyrimidine transport system permease subunit
MLASAVFAAVFSFVAEVVTGSVELLSPGLVIARLAVRIASALVFTGFISYLAGKGLAHTGVLKSYPAGGDAIRVRVLDD